MPALTTLMFAATTLQTAKHLDENAEAVTTEIKIEKLIRASIKCKIWFTVKGLNIYTEDEHNDFMPHHICKFAIA